MPGKFLMEIDLVGAEWVVVAYLANDPNMIGVVKSGKSPHVVTGSLISGASEEFVLQEHKAVGSHTDPDTIASLRQPLDIPEGIFLPRTMSIRQAGKKSNHGLNYGLRYKAFALHNEIAEGEAALMVEAYSKVAYPGMEEWWKSIREELRSNDRCLHNCFGRKVRLLNEWGPDLWNQAYSFKPQSTVGDCCLEGMCLTFEDDAGPFEEADLGAQVHDSLMLQYPLDRPDEAIGYVARKLGLDYMRSELTYSGHTFRLDTELKVGFDWGEMKTVPWGIDDLDQGTLIKQTLSALVKEPAEQLHSEIAQVG